MREVGAGRRASVLDVARAAGVSAGTVSNVLNKPELVAADTRQRVEAAIVALDFVPSGAARQLRVGTSTTVGAIVLDLSNPFYTDVARGIEYRLAADDWTLMVASSEEDPHRESRFLRLFEQQGARGIAVVPTSDDLEHLLALQQRGVRIVLLDRPSRHDALSSVAVDAVAGGTLAAAHLVERGHTKIAFLNGSHAIRQCADRHTGVVDALRSAGLDPAESLVEVTVRPSADGGEHGARELLALPVDQRPTAIFCVNDMVALGVLRTLRCAGIEVPRDIAIVGYDDVAFAAELGVPLTSVRQPTHDLGETAATLLIEGGEPRQVVYKPELVVRASSGP